MVMSLPITAGEHGQRFALGRVDLAGHDRAAGSLAGNRTSAKPPRGPEPSRRRSLASFIKATASVFSAPESATSGSWPAKAANLFGAETNGSGQGGQLGCDRFGEAMWRVQTGTYCGAALRQFINSRKALANRPLGDVELSDECRHLGRR